MDRSPDSGSDRSRDGLHRRRGIQTLQGSTGAATGVPLTDESGVVWFFRPENLELFIKILHARPRNGHFWVFYGSLSNVGFDIHITDTETGATRLYTNPPGQFGSRVDVKAF